VQPNEHPALVACGRCAKLLHPSLMIVKKPSLVMVDPDHGVIVLAPSPLLSPGHRVWSETTRQLGPESYCSMVRAIAVVCGPRFLSKTIPF
jgi:hypothetical protein